MMNIKSQPLVHAAILVAIALLIYVFVFQGSVSASDAGITGTSPYGYSASVDL